MILSARINFQFVSNCRVLSLSLSGETEMAGGLVIVRDVICRRVMVPCGTVPGPGKTGLVDNGEEILSTSQSVMITTASQS